jgi:ABC-type uncharacterized transport system permease subunit
MSVSYAHAHHFVMRIHVITSLLRFIRQLSDNCANQYILLVFRAVAIFYVLTVLFIQLENDALVKLRDFINVFR